MMSLCLRLEARAPARRCHRAYEIVGGQDLFGAWLVEMRYGRIGSLGQSRTRSFGDVDEAVALVAACLRKRATAPRRIGVAYRLRRAVCGGDWQSLEAGLRRFAEAPVQASWHG
ncbi:MAG: WGR domain-containing protein, partial [Acetobacteraceae bacterium]